MLVLNSKDEVMKLQERGVALTVGSFDGVHLGHQYLVSVLKKQAGSKKTAVLTFDPHPEKILSPHPSLQMFNRDDQIEAFSRLGIDYLFFIPFDKNLSKLIGAEFAQEYIFDLFHPSEIVVGYDFVFGQNRSGNYELLCDMARESKAKVTKVEPVFDDGEIISSSLLRRIIIEGQMERAKKLLGRPFYILGSVIQGKKLGRQLGFPTANVAIKGEMSPGSGVYYCRAIVEGSSYKAVCNIGVNPTVSLDQDRKVECHLLDFDKDIYGRNIKIVFFKKIRDEKKFPSVEALRLQIADDIKYAIAMGDPSH